VGGERGRLGENRMGQASKARGGKAPTLGKKGGGLVLEGKICCNAARSQPELNQTKIFVACVGRGGVATVPGESSPDDLC